MTFQGTSSHSSRGQRLHQPSDTREARKPARPSNMITMCDGTMISQRIYNHLRSTAHQKFRGSHDGCAQAIKRAIPKGEWTQIMSWIDEHRPQFGHNSRQNDSLMAVLIGHAAQKSQMEIQALYESILEGRSAHLLLPTN